MAEPHTLAVGDFVRHPEWPDGVTRRVLRLYPCTRMARVDGRARPVLCPNERVAVLDSEIEGDDGWMEAGLEKA